MVISNEYFSWHIKTHPLCSTRMCGFGQALHILFSCTFFSSLSQGFLVLDILLPLHFHRPISFWVDIESTLLHSLLCLIISGLNP